MEKYPPHNEKHFYKYVSIETAKIILNTRKFRYSSPLLFNDPFDVQTELMFNFDINNFHNEIIDEMTRLASLDGIIPFEEDTDLKKAIVLLNKHIQKEGKVNALMKYGLVAIIKDISQVLEETRLNYNYMWKEFLKALRVFSMSTKYDSILMWSHYANNHTGVVFKLKVLPEEDNLICVAEPVIYKSKPLKFFSKDQLIKDILGIQKLEYNKMYRQYAKIKYDLWSYENEWRVWTFEWDHKNELFSDYKLFPNELETVYFGCNIDDDDLNEIKKLSISVNPKVSFKKATRIAGEYMLGFDEI
jgi:hypothetical protein